MAYTTVQNVEKYFDAAFSTTTTPTLIEVTGIVDSVDKNVDSITGTTFNLVTGEEQIFDLPHYTNEILVRNRPLHAIEHVYVNTGTEFDPVFTTELTFRQIGNIIRMKTDQYGEQKVKAVYTWGYPAPPQDVIDLATLLVVKKILGMDSSRNSDVVKAKVGPVETIYASGLARTANIDAQIKELKGRIGSWKSLSA